jgi:hypothetical protein
MVAFVLALFLAHNAPSGWAYDAFCCGGQDCAPVSGVVATDRGWLVGGELLLYNDPRVRFSQDGGFHLCRSAKGTHCLYVPQSIG